MEMLHFFVLYLHGCKVANTNKCVILFKRLTLNYSPCIINELYTIQLELSIQQTVKKGCYLNKII
jgi:hypothetical protein